MTAQTKYFIAPADIIAVRLECGKCGTSVCIGISPEVEFDSLVMCPTCRTAWLAFPGNGASTLVPQVKQFSQAIKSMADAMGVWDKGMETLNLPKFTITVEIKGPISGDY